MKRVSMIATRPMKYGGRSLKTGDPFEARSDHARLYRAIKHAKLAPAPTEAAPTAAAEPAAPVYQTRAIQPEPTPPAEPVLPGTEDTVEASPRRRAIYRRRDMRVEE